MDIGTPVIKQIDIRTNLAWVKERIAVAANTAGRDTDHIKLVVVTKTHPIEVIQAVIDAGVTDIGENYVEEAVPKIQILSTMQGIKWHMVGHVQSRKASSVCEYFHYIHSLDNVKLAERLNRFGIELDKTLPAYLEINVSGEVSKSGWNIQIEENWAYILSEIKQVIALPRLKILGLMTIPPYSTDAEASRPHYRKLKEFQRYVIDQIHLPGFRELSIGMSGDFEVAIQEGSTCVRIGQAILGPRTT